MPAVQASGTKTLTATEDTVGSVASNYVLVASIDLGNMAAGDVVVAKMKRSILSGGAQRIAWQETFSGVQNDPIQQSIPVSAPFGAILTLQQTAGTFRDVPWSVEAIA